MSSLHQLALSAATLNLGGSDLNAVAGLEDLSGGGVSAVDLHDEVLGRSGDVEVVLEERIDRGSSRDAVAVRGVRVNVKAGDSHHAVAAAAVSVVGTESFGGGVATKGVVVHRIFSLICFLCLEMWSSSRLPVRLNTFPVYGHTHPSP